MSADGVNWRYAAAKRLWDIVFSLLGLLISWPALAIIAAAVKASSPGPVIYKGRRVGRRGKLFCIWKFRTMVANAERLGGSATAQDDPRITAVGHVLRKYKLDELPQFWNVLKGEMSFVGARPEVVEYVDLANHHEKTILNMRPGITDWASIWDSNEGETLAGKEDPEQFYLEFIRPAKVRLEYFYATNCSFWTDLKIICYTLYRLANPGWLPPELSEHNAKILTEGWGYEKTDSAIGS